MGIKRGLRLFGPQNLQKIRRIFGLGNVHHLPSCADSCGAVTAYSTSTSLSWIHQFPRLSSEKFGINTEAVTLHAYPRTS